MPLSVPSAAMCVNGDVVSTPLKSNRTASIGGTRRTASARVLVGDRETAVLAERLRRDTNPDRSLATLPLGDVDQARDAVDEHRIEAGLDQLGPCEIAFDVRREDRVEQLVRRKVLVVALPR